MTMTIKEFLAKSYTAYHTVKNCKTILEEKGFCKLEEGEKWQLKKGGKYYVTKNDSAIIAFVLGDMTEYAYHIAESHTDSPSLKIKGKSFVPSPEGYRLNVEKYGGGLLYSMLNIPLRIGGRVIVKEEGELITKIIETPFNVTIPSMCIHHNPGANEGLALNPQNDMLPLIGKTDKENLYELLGESNILDGDLYVVPDVPPYESGINGEYLVSPRIDNLTSVYSSLIALADCENVKGVGLACCFDNEEIGSGTKQGAESSFLYNTLMRINKGLGLKKEDLFIALAKGLALSIDNGHAVHPAHPEKSDITEKVYIDGGIVIKHHPNYATDGMSSALVKAICDKGDIKYQDYYNRSDVRCGGTLGLITSAMLDMDVCDIGLAQLAMHSAIETVGITDIARMEKLVGEFFATDIVRKDGKIQLK